eukprot:499606_1
MNVDWKIEEEEEKYSKVEFTELKSNLSSTVEFVEPRDSDYINCQSNDHSIENCNVMKRIYHLLKHYQTQQHMHQKTYDYLSTFNNYNMSTFMEDWHQVKKNHLKEQKGVDLMRKYMHIHCEDVSKCQYTRRHQRNRENEIYCDRNMDDKNVVLRDQLDSIHTYICHLTDSRKNNAIFSRIYCSDDNDIKDEKDELSWSNKPESISECNPEQIVLILENFIFDKLNPKPREKLRSFKSRIILYIKEHEVDGNKLKQTPRKQFASDMIQYLNIDNTFKHSLAALYTAIIKYDVKKIFEAEEKTDDIWSNKPQSIQKCNIDQITEIIDHVIKSIVVELTESKENILRYIKQQNIDGKVFFEMNRKDFMNKIAAYLQNNKKKILLGKLRKNVLEFDLSTFTGITISPKITKTNTE